MPPLNNVIHQVNLMYLHFWPLVEFHLRGVCVGRNRSNCSKLERLLDPALNSFVPFYVFDPPNAERAQGNAIKSVCSSTVHRLSP